MSSPTFENGDFYVRDTPLVASESLIIGTISEGISSYDPLSANSCSVYVWVVIFYMWRPRFLINVN
jgi:hypothetical protein